MIYWGRRSYTDGSVTVMMSTGEGTGDCVEVPVWEPPIDAKEET